MVQQRSNVNPYFKAPHVFVPAFTPILISGLQLWLRADNITGLSDGDAVGTWTDDSGQGNDATQSTAAKKPVYKTNIVEGKPVVRFDATDDYLQLPDFASGFTAGEIFIVVKVTLDPPTDAAKNALWSFTTATERSTFPHTDSKIYDGWGSTTRDDTGDPTTSLAQWNVYNVISTSSEWTSNINDAQHYTTATNTVDFRTDPRLGSSRVNDFLDGDIAEVVMFNAKLATADHDDVFSYLKYKYATP